jgi:hypothetical protein
VAAPMSRRRPAGRMMAIAALSGLTALLAGGAAAPAPASAPSRAPGAHEPGRTAVLSGLTDASATGYQPPPINPAWYKACVEATPPTATNASVYLTGWANAGKLRESLPTGYPDAAFASAPGGTEGNFGDIFTTSGTESVGCDLTTVQLDYQGLRELPPIRVSGLAFGFEPVTATAILSQAGPQPLSTMLVQDLGPDGGFSNGPYTMVSVARLQLRLTDVTISGVPLQVGNSCRTDGVLTSPDNSIAPGELVLTGNAAGPLPSWTSSLSGGTVAALASIPPFTGCVTPAGENLDALLTATVSGPGNYVQTTAGPPCLGTGGCVTGENEPKFPPLLITVTDGGRYSSESPLMLTETGGPAITINCASSSISGVFPDAEGPPRGAMASVNFSGISGCTGSDGSGWQISSAATAYFSALKYVPARASWNNGAQITGITLDLAGTGTGAAGTCYAVLSGYVDASFTNNPAVIPVNSGPSLYVTQSTCPDLVVTGPVNDYSAVEAVGTYPLTPSGITLLPMVLPTP